MDGKLMALRGRGFCCSGRVDHSNSCRISYKNFYIHSSLSNNPNKTQHNADITLI